MHKNFYRETVSLDVEKMHGRAREATYDIMQRMWFVCWMTKATDTLTILKNFSFPRQHRLWERVSLLRLYIHCLSFLQNTLTPLHFEGFRAENFVVFEAVMSIRCVFHEDPPFFPPAILAAPSSPFYVTPFWCEYYAASFCFCTSSGPIHWYQISPYVFECHVESTNAK